MSEMIEVTGVHQLNELLQSSRPVLIDFHAPWCGPCQSMLPIILILAKQYSDKVHFAKINIDQLPTVASEYKVSSIPYLVLVQQRSTLGELVGLQSQTSLNNFLVKHLPTR